MPAQCSTTHVILERRLVLHKREDSPMWQCRHKVAGRWIYSSTKELELEKAKARAITLMGKAEGRVEEGKPALTRRFSMLAQAAILRMENAPVNTKGSRNFPHYIAAIKNYLIPALGKYRIDAIDHAALHELDQFRNLKMGKAPTKSTLHTHNAALNRVFDEAMIGGFITKSNIPTLSYSGAKSERRGAFTMRSWRTL
jgi:hypothetical protein